MGVSDPSESERTAAQRNDLMGFMPGRTANAMPRLLIGCFPLRDAAQSCAFAAGVARVTGWSPRGHRRNRIVMSTSRALPIEQWTWCGTHCEGTTWEIQLFSEESWLFYF